MWRPRIKIGIALGRQLVTACVAALVLASIVRATQQLLPPQFSALPRCFASLYPPRTTDDEVNAKLREIPGKHLVFVRYSPTHSFFDEWVFNLADLQNERIVYARPYTPESDQALAHWLRGHDVWLLEPDAQPYRLTKLETWPLESVRQ